MGLVLHVVGVQQEPVVSQHVSLLHGLHAVWTVWDAQAEGTLVVGLNQVLAGIVHGLAVQFERYARHGDAGVAVIDVTRVNHILVLVEVVVGEHVGFARERDGAAAREGLHASVHLHADIELTCATIDQTFLLEVASLVSGHLVLRTIERLGDRVFRFNGHLHTSHSGAVSHTHITANHGSRFTFARPDFRPYDMYTFTLGDAFHHVVVGLLYIHILVLEEILLYAPGDGVSPLRICIARVWTAQDAEEVALATRCAPVQHHAALFGGGAERVDFSEVHEFVVRPIALVTLPHLHHEGVGIEPVDRCAENLHLRVVAEQHEVEVIFHTLAGQIVGELMFVDGIPVVRKVDDVRVAVRLALRVDTQFQLGTWIPHDDAVVVAHFTNGGCHTVAIFQPIPSVHGQQVCNAHVCGTLSLQNLFGEQWLNRRGLWDDSIVSRSHIIVPSTA